MQKLVLGGRSLHLVLQPYPNTQTLGRCWLLRYIGRNLPLTKLTEDCCVAKLERSPLHSIDISVLWVSLPLQSGVRPEPSVAARTPGGGEGEGPLPQVGRQPGQQSGPRPQALQQAVVRAEVHWDQDGECSSTDGGRQVGQPLTWLLWLELWELISGRNISTQRHEQWGPGDL